MKDKTWQGRFVEGLDKAIEFHEQQRQPCDTTAVMLALIEVRDAFKEATKRESGWKS